MNIAKYFEEGVALTTNSAQMIIIKRSIDCYSIEIPRNSDFIHRIFISYFSFFTIFAQSLTQY